MTVPARPIYSNIGNLTFSTGYNYAQLSAENIGLLQEHELGLAVENDDLPSEPPISVTQTGTSAALRKARSMWSTRA